MLFRSGLGSPLGFAFRSLRGTFAAWILGSGFFALVLGAVSKGITANTLPPNVRAELERLGAGAIATPAGYLSLVFLFFVFSTSLYACAQIAALRREEVDQQLETLFALPVSRRHWFASRLALAVAGAVAIAVAAAVFAWLGAVASGVSLSLLDTLGSGLNCLPTVLLFLGLSALAFAAAPRASGAVAYGAACVAFLWELFGGLLGVPTWVLGLSPYHHIGLVPTQPFRATAALVMLGIGAALMVVGAAVFERRDLTGA